MANSELKAKLEADAAAIIDSVMAKIGDREMNLTEIEDVALEARAEFGRQLAERLVALQVAQRAHELPMNAEGKRLHPKGKKRKLSRRELGR